MNGSQRKILAIACFVFSPLFMLLGLVQDNSFVLVIVPIASIFAGLFFAKSDVQNIKNRLITYDEYANKILPITLKYIANGVAEELIKELRERDNEVKASEIEIQKIIVGSLNIDAVRSEFIEVLRKSYTNDEFQYLANYALSPTGLKIMEKSQKTSNEIKEVLMPELMRVTELLDEKYNLSD
jgi:hypothetical protein